MTGTIEQTTSSSVSQIFRDFTETSSRETESRDCSVVRENQFAIRVAASLQDREQAYTLAYNVYRRMGYTPENSLGWLVHGYDAKPDTITLLAEGREQQPAGTVSLVFDSFNSGLPCDEIFGDITDELRRNGRKIAEVTRLVVASSGQPERCLLVRLFNLIYIFAHLGTQRTDLLIEVNPKHVGFYQRLLTFDVIGPERECPRVNGAPAVLLRLDLKKAGEILNRLERAESEEWAHLRNTPAGLFYSREQSETMARRMLEEQRAVSPEELTYFGLS